MSIVCQILQLYVFVVLGRVVISWFPVSGPGPLATVQRVLYSLTEPILRPIRSLLPPVRLGGAGLDLSPIVLLIAIQVLVLYICG